ncbi:MAG: nuclear transport factor 2 family protein [Armatimonadetes bacterium]|nr:nuclear transport factor 2 family protein [Armatimonadota bacterium]
MTRRKLLAAGSLMALLALGSGLPAHAQDAAVRAAINRTYNQYAQALKTGDARKAMAVIQANTTPDFTQKMKNGQVVKRPQILQSLQQAAKQGIRERPDQVVYKLVNLKVNKNQALSTAQVQMSDTRKGPDGKTHRMSVKSITRDTWVKAGNAWKLKQSQEVSQQIMLDGKPFDPQAMMRDMQRQMQQQQKGAAKR